MTPALKYVIVIIAGYLLGSVSFGLAISKLRHGPNLRKVGSGNTGATNVTRVMGLSSGLFTFFGDAFKAFLAGVIGGLILGRTGALAGSLAAVIGHDWPVFYGFKGGKGAASTVGAMLACFPFPVAVLSCLISIAIIWLTRFVSVGSMLLVVLNAAFLAVWHPGDWLALGWALILAVMLIIRHRENIKRLIAGTESRFTGKKHANLEEKK